MPHCLTRFPSTSREASKRYRMTESLGAGCRQTLAMVCCVLFAVPFERVKVNGPKTVFPKVPNGRAGQTDQCKGFKKGPEEVSRYRALVKRPQTAPLTPKPLSL